MKKWNKKQLLCVIVICLIVLTVWMVQGNTKLELTEYNVISSKVPEPFVCFEIAQVSDLHNAEFGEENSDLLALLSEVEPHVIVLTGDLSIPVRLILKSHWILQARQFKSPRCIMSQAIMRPAYRNMCHRGMVLLRRCVII